ncbi:hypothetical protein K9N68_37345 (plasmid) [Kovacikia minuta CCNUW1]|uniref:hypothetical protein n=1 Tax=Kovacikia minuta TaxID=2931930 RepID=UPI001CCF14BC|nr:hypothetical protein [Kovacikia minuta]UBF29879.1 hypothetical protein K9N68_37345 [Kovacikia minuta CCNUW1]
MPADLYILWLDVFQEGMDIINVKFQGDQASVFYLDQEIDYSQYAFDDTSW